MLYNTYCLTWVYCIKKGGNYLLNTNKIWLWLDLKRSSTLESFKVPQGKHFLHLQLIPMELDISMLLLTQSINKKLSAEHPHFLSYNLNYLKLNWAHHNAFWDSLIYKRHMQCLWHHTYATPQSRNWKFPPKSKKLWSR